jgi:hypothetical protein
MRTKKVSRHYCDFCNRGGFYRRKMEIHEAGCTANPNRKCNVCASVGTAKMSALLKILDSITEENKDTILMALKLKANYCPACVFAALRQHKRTSITNLDPEDQRAIIAVNFNIKDEWLAWQKGELHEQKVRDEISNLR